MIKDFMTILHIYVCFTNAFEGKYISYTRSSLHQSAWRLHLIFVLTLRACFISSWPWLGSIFGSRPATSCSLQSVNYARKFALHGLFMGFLQLKPSLYGQKPVVFFHTTGGNITFHRWETSQCSQNVIATRPPHYSVHHITNSRNFPRHIWYFLFE